LLLLAATIADPSFNLLKMLRMYAVPPVGSSNQQQTAAPVHVRRRRSCLVL